MYDKVTRDILRGMKIGEVKSFMLPCAQACDTGKVMAYQMQNILGCKFTTKTDYSQNKLEIRKCARKKP